MKKGAKTKQKKQWVVMTVGKTHAGKSTFCAKLLPRLKNAVIVESDPLSTFLNQYHREIYQDNGAVGLWSYGRRKLHHKIWKSIVDHGIKKGFSILLPNANLVRSFRSKTIRGFHRLGVKVAIVYFDLPDQLLKTRIEKAGREKSMLTVSKDFHKVLDKQNERLFEEPHKSEADAFFTISKASDYSKTRDNIAKLLNK